FLEAFESSQTVGTALRRVRHAAFARGNVLGLAYTAYAPAGLRLEGEGDHGRRAATWHRPRPRERRARERRRALVRRPPWLGDAPDGAPAEGRAHSRGRGDRRDDAPGRRHHGRLPIAWALW